MATVYPNANSVWSNTAIWYDDATGLATGQVPQAGDTVLLNGKTITMDVSTSIDYLKNIAGTTAIIGGYVLFSTGGYDMYVANDIVMNTSAIMYINHSGGGHTEVQCDGTLYSGTTSSDYISVTIGAGNTCELILNDMVHQGSTQIIYLQATLGNVTITLPSGWKPNSNFANYAIYPYLNTGDLTINGDISSNTGALEKNYFLYSRSYGTITVNGDISGNNVVGGSLYMFQMAYNNSNLIINGDVTAGAAYACIAQVQANIINVLGTTKGSSGSTTSYAIDSYVGSTVNVEDVEADLSAAIKTDDCTLTVNGNLTSKNGLQPIFGNTWFVGSSGTQIITQQDSSNNGRAFSTALVDTGVPAEEDVRKDTVYGMTGAYTGTLAVPTPAQVLIDVPTDDTVGTFTGGGASLTAEEVWNFPLTGIVDPNVTGTKLINNASIDDVGNIISSYEV